MILWIFKDLIDQKPGKIYAFNFLYRSLVICPGECGNIARFLSGVNNYNPDKASSTNVRSARFRIRDEVRVILYARRNIAAGEILYYDYNALVEKQFNTKDFE